jgi:flagellar biosynthesis/type III secretory pathway protein FliH
MNIDDIKKNLKRAGLLLSLAFGLLVLTGIDAKAQYNNRDRDNDDYYNNQDRRDRRDRRRDRDRDNNDNYGNNNGYYNNGYNNYYRIAQQNGYQDGLNKGIEEAREGDRYNPQDTRPYKNGLNGYDRSFGNRDEYKRIYRQAFLQGFRRGYSQGNNRNRRWGY